MAEITVLLGPNMKTHVIVTHSRSILVRRVRCISSETVSWRLAWWVIHHGRNSTNDKSGFWRTAYGVTHGRTGSLESMRTTGQKRRSSICWTPRSSLLKPSAFHGPLRSCTPHSRHLSQVNNMAATIEPICTRCTDSTSHSLEVHSAPISH